MRKATKLEPRAMMELVIEVMRLSRDEPRPDGKACPRVGAVLVKPDGTIETACRGELRHGDHAEYTLLERKNRDVNLDGSVLFATLEPCAPKARRPPKLGCAERIVLARIKEVWVGIEDPDPTVDRKGIKYLQDAGVDVHMFDPDLQDIIREVNKDFIAQALVRAAAAEEEHTPEITLTTLELTSLHTSMDDLSNEALEAYRTIAGMDDAVNTDAFARSLVHQGLLKQDGDRFCPTGFGIVLFGKKPRFSLPQAVLLGTIHFAGGGEEIKNFEGPQVFAPEQAIQWLRDKLPNPIDRTEAHRREVNQPLYELVREGIVNALVHRDYDIVGGKCQLIVSPDKIVVMSPGLPVKPITLDQLKSFNAPMLSRNPVLHFVFASMKMAEERGLGLRSLMTRALELGLPRPRYTWNDPYLVLTFFRSAEAAAREVSQDGFNSLGSSAQAVLKFISTRETVAVRDVVESLGLDRSTAQRALRKLEQEGVLCRIGTGRSTYYRRPLAHGSEQSD